SVYHQYQDARVDNQGEGWLGFTSHIVTDGRNGAVTRTKYDFTRTANPQWTGASPSYRYPFAGTPTDIVTVVQADGTLYETHTAVTLREMCSASGTGTFTYERARETRSYAGPADTGHPGDPYGLLENPELAFSGRVLTGATVTQNVTVDGYNEVKFAR